MGRAALTADRARGRAGRRRARRGWRPRRRSSCLRQRTTAPPPGRSKRRQPRSRLRPTRARPRRSCWRRPAAGRPRPQRSPLRRCPWPRWRRRAWWAATPGAPSPLVPGVCMCSCGASRNGERMRDGRGAAADTWASAHVGVFRAPSKCENTDWALGTTQVAAGPPPDAGGKLGAASERAAWLRAACATAGPAPAPAPPSAAQLLAVRTNLALARAQEALTLRHPTHTTRGAVLPGHGRAELQCGDPAGSWPTRAAAPVRPPLHSSGTGQCGGGSCLRVHVHGTTCTDSASAWRMCRSSSPCPARRTGAQARSAG